ncbi:MAG: zinc ribbon domain-containing protein [Deltaproteobacteria bacterium]|nr:zinc ribbon domain-containing protein [Deltaproteobacteria bacterium]
MPIYEYQCPDCGHLFEVLQKFSDEPVSTCPKCSLGNVKKLISQTSFVLKGGGWYNDHYGLKSGGGEKGAEKGAEKAADKPSATATPAASTPAAAPAAPAPASSSTPSSSSSS